MISKKEKFKLIKLLSNKYPIRLLCEIAEVSHSGYYKWLSRKATADIDAEVKAMILNIYHTSKKRFGYRRVYMELRETYGLKINHKRVKRLMNILGIKSIVRKKRFKYPVKNTNGTKNIEPNILNREFMAERPNEKWSTDITYLYYGKKEEIKVNKYQTFSELSTAVTEYIYWYNNFRRQQKLKNLTPVEYRCQMKVA